MRVLLFLAVATALLLPTDLALGQGGTIVLYTAPTFGRTDCNVVDSVGVHAVYAVHEYMWGAKASRWALANHGHTMTWLMDEPAPGVTAYGHDSQGGWALHYGACRQPPFLIATIWYQGYGTSPDCSRITVVPDPMDVTGHITGSDCADGLTFPDAGPDVMVNENGSCPCYHGPVEQSTWGQVKALYE